MIKIVAAAIVCAFILIYLKSVNSDLFGVAVLGAGVIIISMGLDYLSDTLSFFNKISELSGLNSQYFSIILKITGIAYIVEFGAGIVEDLGLKSLSDKLVFVGKLAIITASIPIIYAVFNILIGLI